MQAGMIRPISLLYAVFVAFLFSGFAPVASLSTQSDQRRLGRDQTNVSEKRVALVIGNGAYAKGRLRNPPNDARAMAAALREVGFETTEIIDADKVRIQRALRDFGKRLRESGGVGLFYYAGHGVQVAGRNFLVPIGGESEVEAEADVDIFCIDAENVLRQMEEAGSRINIVILDACRDNPFSRSFKRDTAGGLAEIKAPSGTLIAYATDPGRTASDGDGDNGLYTQELLARMREPGLRIEDVFNLAGAEVERKSGRKQQPWISSKLRGAFYFREPVGSGPAPLRPGPAADPEVEAWNDIRDSKRAEDFRRFLKEFPNGKYAGSARVKLGRIEDESNPPPNSTTGSKPSSPTPGTQIEAAAGIKLVYIPAGEFQMGSSDRDVQEAYVNLKGYFSSAQPAWFSNEQPKHRVLMTEPFWMGKFEVTQAEWEAVMGSNPSQFRNCPTCPVENVSWDDCQAFIRKLNEMGDGNTYSLPTEAEWEYACRAGTTTPFSFGATTSPGQMNYDGNYPYVNAAKGLAREKPVQVGSLNQPNPWGLYDMHGNVWEWCADWYGATYYGSSSTTNPKGPLTGDSRVLRGGSYGNAANACRSAGRAWTAPGGRFPFNGLRVVMHSTRK